MNLNEFRNLYQHNICTQMNSKNQNYTTNEERFTPTQMNLDEQK